MVHISTTQILSHIRVYTHTGAQAELVDFVMCVIPQLHHSLIVLYNNALIVYLLFDWNSSGTNAYGYLPAQRFQFVESVFLYSEVVERLKLL